MVFKLEFVKVFGYIEGRVERRDDMINLILGGLIITATILIVLRAVIRVKDGKSGCNCEGCNPSNCKNTEKKPHG